MVLPKLYSCSPQQATALMMLALWITSTLMPFSMARSVRSVCVVALLQGAIG